VLANDQADWDARHLGEHLEEVMQHRATFLLDFPDPSTLTRAESVGGTSTTSSPAANSC
jgi:hypothetical protein